MVNTQVPQVDGIVYIDLRSLNDYLDQHQICRLIQGAIHAPAGCEVHFDIAPGQMSNTSGLGYLARHGRHLGRIVFRSDESTVREWVQTLRLFYGEVAR